MIWESFFRIFLRSTKSFSHSYAIGAIFFEKNRKNDFFEKKNFSFLFFYFLFSIFLQIFFRNMIDPPLLRSQLWFQTLKSHNERTINKRNKLFFENRDFPAFLLITQKFQVRFCWNFVYPQYIDPPLQSCQVSELYVTPYLLRTLLTFGDITYKTNQRTILGECYKSCSSPAGASPPHGSVWGPKGPAFRYDVEVCETFPPG